MSDLVSVLQHLDGSGVETDYDQSGRATLSAVVITLEKQTIKCQQENRVMNKMGGKRGKKDSVCEKLQMRVGKQMIRFSGPCLVCCPCQCTERGGRLGVELSAPRRKWWPAAAWGWGTGLVPGEPEPAGRPGPSPALPCWSRRAPGRWRWHPAAVWRCCRRSADSGDAAPSRLPLCKELWCQHHSSLRGKVHKQTIISSFSFWLHYKLLTAPFVATW